MLAIAIDEQRLSMRTKVAAGGGRESGQVRTGAVGACLCISLSLLLPAAVSAANYSGKTGRQTANSSSYRPAQPSAQSAHSAAYGKGKPKAAVAPRAKSPEQMMQMLDDFEKSLPLSNAPRAGASTMRAMPAGGYSRAMLSRPGIAGMRGGFGAGMRSAAIQPMPAGNSSRMMLNNLAQKIQAMRQGGPGQPPMMQMLQQQMQGGAAGGGGLPPRLGQMLQQGMQAQGGQGPAAMSPLMQRFSQQMSGTNSGMSGGSQLPFGGGRMAPSAPNLLQKARMMSGSRGGQPGGFPAQSHSAGATGSSAQDLQKQLEEQYGN